MGLGNGVTARKQACVSKMSARVAERRREINERDSLFPKCAHPQGNTY